MHISRRVLAAAVVVAVSAGPLLPPRADARLAPNAAICFVPPGFSDHLLIANITPVNAARPGWGRLVSQEHLAEATTSNVNFGPGSIDPNIALTELHGGSICYQTSDGGDSDVIIDIVGWISSSYVVVSDRASARVVDTRVLVGGARLASGARRCFPVQGEPGQLAILNLTPLGAERAGHGQLISSDTAGRPIASNVNFTPSSVDPNLAAAVIGSDGEVCFLNSEHGAVDLVADHLATLSTSGFWPTPTGSPTRLVDTRIGLGGDAVAPGETRCFGATAGAPGALAAVNLTVVNATAPGHGRLESSGEQLFAPPVKVSHVNFGPGTVDPNVAFAQIGDDGRVCYVNSDHATVDLIADQLFAANGRGDNTRIVDTRSPVPTATACLTARDCVAFAPANTSIVSSTSPASLLWSSDGGITWYHSQSTLNYPLQFDRIRCDIACYVDGHTPGTGLNPSRPFTLTSTDLGRTWGWST